MAAPSTSVPSTSAPSTSFGLVQKLSELEREDPIFTNRIQSTRAVEELNQLAKDLTERKCYLLTNRLEVLSNPEKIRVETLLESYANQLSIIYSKIYQESDGILYEFSGLVQTSSTGFETHIDPKWDEASRNIRNCILMGQNFLRGGQVNVTNLLDEVNKYIEELEKNLPKVLMDVQQIESYARRGYASPIQLSQFRGYYTNFQTSLAQLKDIRQRITTV